MVQIRVSPTVFSISAEKQRDVGKNSIGSGGIRTHASEETGALNQRLRPLGHATLVLLSNLKLKSIVRVCKCPS